MEISKIKESFWIPGNCYYIKEKETPKRDEYFVKVNVGEHLEIDNFQPKQIYYILDSNPKLILEFDPEEYRQIIRILYSKR